jgi:hypothetical protein
MHTLTSSLHPLLEHPNPGGVLGETRIFLNDAPAHLATTSNGRRINYSTIHR